MSKNSSKNLSNENKHTLCFQRIGILIHGLSWRQQKHQCLFSLLRFFDKLFDNNWRSILDVVKILRFRVHQFKTSADKKRSVCCHDSSSAKPAQVGADYPRANDRTIFWPMLAHTADRQQLGSSPGFTFQEVGVCVVPMNQEETRSLEIFDIVYSSGLSSLGVLGVPWHPQIFADQFTLY